MFWESFWSNLASGIALLFLGRKKEKSIEAKQTINNNQKKKSFIDFHIGPRYEVNVYQQYAEPFEKIPPAPISDTTTSVTGRSYNVENKKINDQ